MRRLSEARHAPPPAAAQAQSAAAGGEAAPGARSTWSPDGARAGAQAASGRRRFRRLVLSHLRESRRDLALAALCVAGSTAATLLAPWPLKLAFDHVLLERPLQGSLSAWAGWLAPGSLVAIAALSAAILLIALLRGAFAWSQVFLTSRIGQRLVHRLRAALFDHLQRLSLSFHHRARSGELLSKVASDTATLKDAYTESALVFVTHALTIAGMLAVMFVLDPSLAAVVAAVFPLLFLGGHRLLRRAAEDARRQRRREGRIASRLADVLGALPLVQAFGRERYERERFESESAASLDDSLRSARNEAAATRVVEIVSAVATASVLMLGAMQAFRGRLSPGDLLVFLTYVSGMFRPVRQMAKLSGRFSRAAASAERIAEVLEVEPDIDDAPDAIEARGLRGDIEFDRVSFSYPDGRAVLRDVSFRVRAGERVALVGPSGAGKSTIAHLLLRLYDPDAGRVLLDGIDLRRYTRESARRWIGVVLQEPTILAASLAENIRYGAPEAADDAVVAAATAAGLHDFITTLPEGYDAGVGERGALLSGGQRQRLALARALVKRPAILVMDEPTSAVDSASAAGIREALRRAQAERTMLLIAHDVDEVRDCDRILVLESGRIVERGSHAELSARDGRYARLFRLSGRGRGGV